MDEEGSQQSEEFDDRELNESVTSQIEDNLELANQLVVQDHNSMHIERGDDMAEVQKHCDDEKCDMLELPDNDGKEKDICAAKDDVNNLSLQHSELTYSEDEIVGLSNTFPLLESYFNNPSTLLIFTYLSSLELIQLALVSPGFYHASKTPLLWKELLNRDFNLTKTEIATFAEEPNISPLPLLIKPTINPDSAHIAASRSYYIHKWKGLSSRRVVARNRCDNYKKELREDKQKERVECCLDWTLLRLFVPFLLASVFSSMLLVAMWIDGTLATNVFVCLSPFLFFMFYVFVCFAINYYLFKKQSYDGSSSFLGDMWSHTQGAMQFLYVEVFEESNTAVLVSFIAIVLLLAQLLLLGFKLSEADVTSDHTQHILQWELVFLPLWLLFILMLVTPCVGCIKISLFVFLFIFVWIPFFILFICLSFKLKGMENNTKTRNLRLALIFIPFWIIEGGVMLGALLAVVEVVYRLRRDLRAYFSLVMERLGIFALVWGLLLPIMIAQSLVSALDDGQQVISAQDVVAPVLFLLSCFFILAVVLSCSYITEFQKYRHQLMLERAGSVALFEV